MQVLKTEIKRQQEILAALGFYHGEIDGIWGPKCIAAKKKFEADRRFTPGIPNNGMPFGARPPYPAGMTLDHATGLLNHPALAELSKKVKTEDQVIQDMIDAENKPSS